MIWFNNLFVFMYFKTIVGGAYTFGVAFFFLLCYVCVHNVRFEFAVCKLNAIMCSSSLHLLQYLTSMNCSLPVCDMHDVGVLKFDIALTTREDHHGARSIHARQLGPVRTIQRTCSSAVR